MMSIFNRNWAGVCRGRWAGPGLFVGWDAGAWIIWAKVGSPRWRPAGSGRNTPLQKIRKKGGSAGALPVAFPMPKSVSF